MPLRTYKNLSEEKSTTMFSAVKCLVKDDSGATLVEYGLLLALVALAAVATMTTLGSNIKTLFTSAANEL